MLNYIDLLKSPQSSESYEPSQNFDKIVAEVQQLRDITKHIPHQLRQDPHGFEKAWKTMSRENALRGPKSAFFDPLSIQYALGYKDRRYSLTYNTLKRVANQLGIIGAIINTRIAQISNFSQPYRTTKSLGYIIRHKDPEHETTASEKRFIKELETFIACCGDKHQNPYTRVRRPKFDSFLKMIIRNSLEYDQLAVEVIPRNNRLPFEFRALDGSTIRIASPNADASRSIEYSYSQRNPVYGMTGPMPYRFGTMYEGQRYGFPSDTDDTIQYVQVIDGAIINVYTDNELIFGVRNPRSDIYCFPPDTKVLTRDFREKKIFDIKVGDEVITHTGDVKKVLKTFCHKHEGDILKIKTRSKYELVECTLEHPFYVVKNSEARHLKDIESRLEWIPARELECGYYLAVPKIRREEKSYAVDIVSFLEGEYDFEFDDHYVWTTRSYGKQGLIDSKQAIKDLSSDTGLSEALIKRFLYAPEDYKYSTLATINEACIRLGIDFESFLTKIPRYLVFDEELAFVAGLYVAEGSVSGDRYVNFSLNLEAHYLARCAKAFFSKLGIGFAEHFHKTAEGRSVVGNSSILARVFRKLFGDGAKDKHFPEGLFSCSTEVKKAFIEGYLLGDGCYQVHKGVPSIDVCSVSSDLVSQLAYLINSLGIFVFPHYLRDAATSYNDKLGEIHTSESFGFSISGRCAFEFDYRQGIFDEIKDKYLSKSRGNHYLESDNYFYVKVTSIESEKYSDYVYNFEVEDHNSYICKYAVHNCQGYGFGEIEQIITIVTAMLYSERYNTAFFQQGAHPKGILNFKGDNWTQEQLACVAEDTLVQTDFGTFEISKILQLQNDLDINFKFWNGETYASGFVSEADVKQLVDVQLDNGYSLKATEDHRVFVLTDTGMEERFVSDLDIGDVLLVNETEVANREISLKDLVPTYYKGRCTGYDNDFSIDEIDSDLWEIIAWMIFDGYISSNYNIINLFYNFNYDEEVFVRHVKILDKYKFPYKVKDNQYSDKGSKICQICYKAFGQFLENVGVGSGRNKKIPWLIFCQSKEKRSSFLRSAFSANGPVYGNGRTVSLASTYKDLIYGSQQLLNTLGVPSYIYFRENVGLYEVIIQHKAEFVERVGFLQRYKNEKIVEIVDVVRTPNDAVPIKLLRHLLEPFRDEFTGKTDSTSKAGLSVINNQKQARIKSRLYWRKFLEDHGDVTGANLLSYRFAKVKNFSLLGKELTYDVTVHEGESPRFMANGLLTHNSFREQWIAQVAGPSGYWKTPITQSEGLEWVNMQLTNQDMQFNTWIEYLIKVCSAVYLIDPAEINFELKGGVSQTPLFESSQEWKLKASRDRGLKPLLKFIAGLINEHIIDVIDDHFCCVPGTGVAQPNGIYKPIEEIQVGDVVWTHNNKHGVVTSVGSREVDEDICRVIPRKKGLKPFEVTGDHPIWVLELEKKYSGVEFTDIDSILTLRIKNNDKDGLPLKFVKASQLEPGRHWLALANPELACCDVDIDLLKYATEVEFNKENSRDFGNLGMWYKNRGYSYDSVAKEFGCSPPTVSRALKINNPKTELQKSIQLRIAQKVKELEKIPKLKRFMKLDVQLARVLGWFVAEGSFNKSGFQFSLCGDTDPVDDLRDFFDKLGAPTSLHVHKGREHVVDLIVYSMTLRKFFQECGSGAANKKIPDIIFSASKEVKLAFIGALFSGDGTFSGVDRAFLTLMISSKQLLDQLQFLLASLGILSGILHRPARKVWYKKEQRYINTNECFVLNINKNILFNVLNGEFVPGEYTVKYRRWNGYFIIPIDEVQRFHYKGPVYNFSVDGDESYVIDSLMIVHNCFEFAGLDELTEQEKHEMLREQVGSYMTLNEGRRSLDLPDIQGGLGDIPLNPTLVQLLQILDQRQQRQDEMEQQQQQAQQQGQEQPQEQMDPLTQVKIEQQQQKMQHQEERHPLEMQLLEQKISEGGGMSSPEGAGKEEEVQRPAAYTDLVGKALSHDAFDNWIDEMRGKYAADRKNGQKSKKD